MNRPNIKINHNEDFSPEEDAKIKADYPAHGNINILATEMHRTYASLCSRAKKLGVQRIKRQPRTMAMITDENGMQWPELSVTGGNYYSYLIDANR
jgi:hypothetical protein